MCWGSVGLSLHTAQVVVSVKIGGFGAPSSVLGLKKVANLEYQAL